MSVLTDDTLATRAVAHGPTVRRLVVAWQHPETRAIEPIGMLSLLDDVYEFRYIRNAWRVAGFRPLLGFPDLSRSYTSATLFPLFAQRAMDPRRPDYERYVRGLGLPADTTPWEQITRSGGRRSGDTLQLFPVPTRNDGELSCAFLVHGIRHIPSRPLELADRVVTVDHDQLERSLACLTAGSELLLIPEPGNPQNSQALLVADQSEVPIGYMPDLLVDDVTELRRRTQVRVTAEVVNGPDAPWHLRVLARLSASPAGEFEFFAGEKWRPIG